MASSAVPSSRIIWPTRNWGLRQIPQQLGIASLLLGEELAVIPQCRLEQLGCGGVQMSN